MGGSFAPALYHFDAHPDEVERARPLEDGEEMRAGLEEGPKAQERTAEGGGVAERDAEGGPAGPARTVGEGEADHEHDRRAGDDEEQRGRGHEGEIGVEGHRGRLRLKCVPEAYGGLDQGFKPFCGEYVQKTSGGVR